jgi:hypothetical protein
MQIVLSRHVGERGAHADGKKKRQHEPDER